MLLYMIIILFSNFVCYVLFVLFVRLESFSWGIGYDDNDNFVCYVIIRN